MRVKFIEHLPDEIETACNIFSVRLFKCSEAGINQGIHTKWDNIKVV